MQPNGSWCVCSTTDKEANKNVGYCHSVDKRVLNPVDVKRWNVVIDGGKWNEQSSVSVVGFSAVKWVKEKVCWGYGLEGQSRHGLRSDK